MISIVITTYGEDYWRELAWERAYPSAELQENAEVVLHHAPDLPIGPARNEAARRATRDWLLFLDADDELEPGYVSAMEDAIVSTPNAERTLFQPSVRYVRKGRAPDPMLAPRKDLRVDNYLVIGTLVHMWLFRKAGGFSDYPHGFEDWSLWAKCWKHGATVVAVPDAIYCAHINPQSQHRRMWRNRREQVEMHLRVQAELFPEGVTDAV